MSILNSRISTTESVSVGLYTCIESVSVGLYTCIESVSVGLYTCTVSEFRPMYM